MNTVFDKGLVLAWIEIPSPGIRVLGGKEHRDVAFEPGAFAAASVGLQARTAESYYKLGGLGEFGRWWLDACGGEWPGIRRFRIQMPSHQWERPWEAIVSALDFSRWDDVSLVRQIERDTMDHHPSELDDPLSILCLQGAADGPSLDRLDLEAEFKVLTAAYDALDLSVRHAISQPIMVKPGFAELEAILLDCRPTVLWFSGHARPNPPGLLLNDGHWLTPEEFSNLLQQVQAKGGRTPLYIILLACETGSPGRFASPTAAPPFINALGEDGVAALLVSQTPLSDVAARQIAIQVFTALASGRPLDHGVARARGELMRLAGANLVAEFDWIGPVVWSKGYLPPSLSWRDGREGKAQRQGAARKLLPAGLRELMPLASQAQQGCLPWPDKQRVWVKSTLSGAAASRLLWAERVLARQNKTERAILWFNFSSTGSHPPPVHRVLGDWANLVSVKIEHDDDRNWTLRTAAQGILEDFEKGWLSLCSTDSFILAIIEPPMRDTDWLWKGLCQSSYGAQIIVLACDFPDDRAHEDWTVDTLIEHQISLPPSESMILSALAVLGHPAARQDIQAQTEQILEPWIEQSIILETNAGCLMPATLSETVARNLSPETRAQAHRLAYSFLDGPVAHRKMSERPREDILRARWSHAQASGWIEAIRIEGTNLLRLYRRQNRALAFLGVFETIVSEQRYLPDDVKISAAWAYLDSGSLDNAMSWLGVMNPNDLEVADAVDWYAVRAEIEKSSGQPGSKAAARHSLESAISLLEEERDETSIHLRLRLQHDIARLVHFFERRPLDAIRLYQEVVAEWETMPFSELDRAITIRNLAEALMDCEKHEEAAIRVVEARNLIPSWTQNIVVSELEYLYGRLAIRMGLNEGEILRRFQECLDRAKVTNHLMMFAIVGARMFWHTDTSRQSPGLFNDTKWDSFSQSLVLFKRHAWAARVLIDGELRAARRLASRGELGRAKQKMGSVRRLIEANPAFEEGSDRRRIVVLYAGLHLYDSSGAIWWDQLKATYDWAQQWLAEQQSDDPTDIWEMAG